MQTQKICFKGDEVMALIKGYPLSAATQAKLALIQPSNEAIRLCGLRFHYDMLNQFHLFMQQQQPEDDKPLPNLTSSGFIDYEALD